MHKIIEPKVLYFGTPVVLISSLNEDGTTNLAPMSSAWWLGTSCMLGMSTKSKTVENLRRYPECVLNLPSADQVGYVNRLAMVTGKNPVPRYKQNMGYRYEPNKFELAGLTSMESQVVKPLRVADCPIQLEATVEAIKDFGSASHHLVSIEVKIKKFHIQEELIAPGTQSYIDTSKWNPLIMMFCEFFGISDKIHSSTLAKDWAPILTE